MNNKKIARYCDTVTKLFSLRSRRVVRTPARHEQARPAHGVRKLQAMVRFHHHVLPRGDEQARAANARRAGDGGHRFQVAPRPVLNAVPEEREGSVHHEPRDVNLCRRSVRVFIIRQSYSYVVPSIAAVEAAAVAQIRKVGNIPKITTKACQATTKTSSRPQQRMQQCLSICDSLLLNKTTLSTVGPATSSVPCSAH